MNPVFFRDGESTPNDWYATFRYLNRMFSETRPHRREEIAAIDLGALDNRVKYLMRHLLILQGLYKKMLDDFPNLRALQHVQPLDEPIILADPPIGEWAYFTSKGILL